MTYRCNHRCLFCSCPWEAGDAPPNGLPRGTEMPTAEWKETISTLCRMGCSNLAFTGGEALLREDIFDLLAYAGTCRAEHIESKNGELVSHFGPPKLYLLSNGTTVTPETLRFCRDHDVQLSLSLPGLSTLREHTGIGDPDVILRHFRAARDLGLHTVVNVTVTRRNLPELYETIAAAFLAGASQLLMNRFLPGGRGLAHASELTLDAAGVRQMLDTAEAVQTAAGRYGSVGTELPKCAFEPGRYKRLTVGTRCSAALGFFVVGPDGHTRVCNHSPVNLVHVREIDKLKDHPYWRTFTQKQYLPAACADCAQAGDCDGGCREAAHIHGGSVDAQDPLLSAACPQVVASSTG